MVNNCKVSCTNAVNYSKSTTTTNTTCICFWWTMTRTCRNITTITIDFYGNRWTQMFSTIQNCSKKSKLNGSRRKWCAIVATNLGHFIEKSLTTSWKRNPWFEKNSITKTAQDVWKPHTNAAPRQKIICEEECYRYISVYWYVRCVLTI